MLQLGEKTSSDYGNTLKKNLLKFRDILIALSLFVFAFIIRLYGGTWDTRIGNDAYMSRQAEYIYSYGHPAVPDPFSSAPLYQPGMAYLLALTGKLFDIVPIDFSMSSMTLAEGLTPPFLGAATVVVIFWLGSRLYNWKAGLISGVFASVSLFLLIRTLKGFTFHDSLSLFLITLTIALVVRAMDILRTPLPAKKKKQAIYLFWILLPAVSLGLTGFSWGGYFVIHAILILYGLLTTLYYFTNKKALYPLSSFWAFIIVTLISGTILAGILYPVRNLEEITRAMQMMGYTSGPMVYKFTADLQPTRFEGLEMFFGKYLILGIIMLLFGLYSVYLKKNVFGMLLISATGISIILGLARVHFMDILSIFGYISIGIGFIAIIELAAKSGPRKRFAIQALSIAAVIILFASIVGPSIDFIKSSRGLNEKTGIGSADMMEGYRYIRNNTAPGALIINWWDYGNDIGYRAQRQTVIDQMYIEDADVINVSKVVMGTDYTEGLQIAKNYKNKYNNPEVYLLIGKWDGIIASIIAYCSGEEKEVFYTFDQTDHIEALTPAASETNYYKLWTNQTVEGYNIVYANKDMKLFQLNV
jgi:asparagine N-glycosylation enzyme membrane subunit Stt3